MSLTETNNGLREAEKLRAEGKDFLSKLGNLHPPTTALALGYGRSRTPAFLPLTGQLAQKIIHCHITASEYCVTKHWAIT